LVQISRAFERQRGQSLLIHINADSGAAKHALCRFLASGRRAALFKNILIPTDGPELAGKAVENGVRSPRRSAPR